MRVAARGFLRSRGCARRRSAPSARCPSSTGRSTRLGAVTSDVAVNVHHGREQLEDHLAGRVHLAVEEVLLGTAGALGNLKTWIDGRDAVVVNADLVTDADLGAAVASWDRERIRLVAAGGAALDPDLRLCAALMPWSSVERLAPEPSGLYRNVVGAGRRRRGARGARRGGGHVVRLRHAHGPISLPTSGRAAARRCSERVPPCTAAPSGACSGTAPRSRRANGSSTRSGRASA